MNSARVRLLLSVLAIVCFRRCVTCPLVCSCKWKHGKQTAECDSKGLSVIPGGVSPETQVLYMSRNNLSEISSKAFQKKGLVHLQKIFISECGISKIAQDAFFQLSNLVELDLSRNNLRTLPSNALCSIPNLRRLQLAHNPILIIENGAFLNLSNLAFLGLSNCQIKHIQLGALTGLEKLDFMELDGNKIETLLTDIFKPVVLLNGIHLHNNPWHCDCKIREIRTWMVNHNIPLSVPPHCENPDYLRGYTWDSLSLDDFACIPEILNAPTEVKVIAGQNASINCLVNSVPKGLVYWESFGKSLKNISSSRDHKLKYHIQKDDSLSHQTSVLNIYNVEESDSDVYSCIAENRAGMASLNFTLVVLCPDQLNAPWDNSQITLLLFGILFVIILSAAIISLLLYHPVSFSFGSKMNRKTVLDGIPAGKDAVEMNAVGEDRSSGDNKVPTGSSGFSDPLAPDLVSKIPDLNKESSLATLTCNTLNSHRPAVMFHGSSDHWSYPRSPNSLMYDGSSPVPNIVYSEIYLNPCYGKDEESCYYSHPLPHCTGIDRFLPQNDNHSQKSDDHGYPVRVANPSGHYRLSPQANVSTDEHTLKGTNV